MVAWVEGKPYHRRKRKKKKGVKPWNRIQLSQPVMTLRVLLQQRTTGHSSVIGKLQFALPFKSKSKYA